MFLTCIRYILNLLTKFIPKYFIPGYNVRLPAPPVIVTARAGEDYINLGWSTMGPHAFYELTYGLLTGGRVNSVIINGHTQQYVIRNLQPDSTYFLDLRSINGFGRSIPTSRKITTRPDVGAITPPVGLKMEPLTPNSVNLTWTDIALGKNQNKNSNHRYYLIKYRKVGPNNGVSQYINSTDLHQVIENLVPKTQYEFFVRVVKGGKYGGWSMRVQGETKEGRKTRA